MARAVAAALSIFTVNCTGDEPDAKPGDGQALTIKGTTTLRAAIMEANKWAGKDRIEFNIPGAGPHVIQPVTALPDIVQPVTIDGFTQPGSQRNTKALNEGCNAVLQIELDGTLAPEGTNGLRIEGGNSTIRGLVIHSFFSTQWTKPRRIDGFGILLGSGNNGGNVISGNRDDGIFIDTTAGNSNVIQGNFIGTDKTGNLSGPTPENPYKLGNGTCGQHSSSGGCSSFSSDTVTGPNGSALRG